MARVYNANKSLRALIPNITNNSLFKILIKFLNSVWLFPSLLTLLLIVVTILKISGSSIGFYESLFFGGESNRLLFNKPQSLRSDEWIVTSQMTIAQKNNDYHKINTNIGDGQDMSILLDVPYKEWSVIFKPQNIAFFILPFDNAFAFKWWFYGYLLILSVYSLSLHLFRNKRLFATLLSLSIFFSPFIQWWYLYGTLGSIYYALFIAVTFMQILKSNSLIKKVLWSLLMTYLITCFILILYPPFQIPAAYALASLCLGYFISWLLKNKRKDIVIVTTLTICSVLVSTFIALSYAHARNETINVIKNTSYPGKRIQESGGFNIAHLMTSNLGGQLQVADRFTNYKYMPNQSESASFVLILPFLLIPSMYLIYYEYRKKKTLDYSLLFVNIMSVFMLIWIFIPGFGLIGKFTLLNMVPHARMLMGIGLLNLFNIILFANRYDKYKGLFSNKLVIIFIAIVVMIQFVFGYIVYKSNVGYIGFPKLVLLTIPIPLILLLFMYKKFNIAVFILLLFTLSMTHRVNPLYVGTQILSNSNISNKIMAIDSKDRGSWVIEDVYLENFASMSGSRSYSGVYTYPQLSIWKVADPNGTNINTYNRYAHVIFNFDRDPSQDIDTKFNLSGGDNFGVITEACGDFVSDIEIKYIISSSLFAPQETCLTLIDKVNYPNITYYYYKINQSQPY